MHHGVDDAPRSAGPPVRRNVEIAGRVDDGHLARLYREAPCVVAPALDEDYGLTAIEAMRSRPPVIVCRDGGGLAEHGAPRGRRTRRRARRRRRSPPRSSGSARDDRACRDARAGARWPPRATLLTGRADRRSSAAGSRRPGMLRR